MTLVATAAVIAVVHTAVGVDHYLPFIVLGRAEGWSLRRTLLWTALCGVGHVLSSVLIGVIGVGLGWAAGRLTVVSELRGEAAALALILFGGGYLLYGLWRGSTQHTHAHLHDDGSIHCHVHHHAQGDEGEHEGIGHTVVSHRRGLWALFIIFVLGPCEPLIALMFAPALQQSVPLLGAVVVAFSVVTVVTMLTLVALGYFGLGLVRLRRLERFGPSLAGLAIVASGAMILLGF